MDDQQAERERELHAAKMTQLDREAEIDQKKADDIASMTDGMQSMAQAMAEAAAQSERSFWETVFLSLFMHCPFEEAAQKADDACKLWRKRWGAQLAAIEPLDPALEAVASIAASEATARMATSRPTAASAVSPLSAEAGDI